MPGPFQQAVATGKVEIVREMLAAGEDPNQLDETGGFAIECAMALLERVDLLGEGADAVRDIFACIELCLDAGALPDGPTTRYAHGRDVSGNGFCRDTPLSLAVEQGRPEFVRLFLSAGADPNVVLNPDRGNTILHHACSLDREHLSGSWGGNRANYEIVRLLLAAGADYAAQINPLRNNIRALIFETPFGITVTFGYHRLWPLFLRAGADIPDFWRGFMETSRNPEVAQRYEYLATIEEAGGFKAYEKAHRTRLLATFTPKFTHLVPEELVPLIVDFSFHIGFYVSAAAVAALSRAAETNPNQED